MASGESVGELYLRLGLDADELNNGFIQAERSIRDNMSRLGRENTMIRLQARVELNGLDESADAMQRFEIQQRSLTRQIENQRHRINLASAAVQEAIDRQGEMSDQAQSARVALERERVALSRMERELRELNETQQETSLSAQDFRDAFNDIAGNAAKVTGAIAAVTAAVTAVYGATLKAVESFRELQKQAYELNMPLKTTDGFLRHLRMGGGDIGDFEGYIRGITDAFVKGEIDDPEFVALDKYGAKIIDTTGRLKQFNEIVEEVYQAWKKADASGEGIEFLQLTGGESGIRDAIQFFKRYEEAKVDAARITPANMDFEELHELDRTFTVLSEQAGEFAKSVANIFTPAVKKGAESFYSVIKTGTEFVNENIDALRTLAELLAKPMPVTIFDKLQELTNGETPVGLLESMITGEESTLSKILSGEKEKLEEYKTQYEKTQAEIEAEAEKTGEQLNNNVLSQYGIQRVKQFRDELEDLRAEMDYGDDEFGKAHAENEIWLRRELNDKLYVTEEERIAILELYAAKEEQIEQRRAAAVKGAMAEAQKANEELENSIYSLTHSDLQNNLRGVESAAKAMQARGADPNLVAQDAELKRSQIIRQFNDETAAYLDSIYENSLQQRLNQIEREKQAWIQKGLDEVRATQAAEQQKKSAMNDSVKNMFTSQKKYLDIYRKAMMGDISSGGMQIYDFGLSEQQKKQNAINAIRRQMMKEAGVSPNEMTDMKEITGFLNALKEAENWGLSLIRDGGNLAGGEGTAAIHDAMVDANGQIESLLGDVSSRMPDISTTLSGILDAVQNQQPPSINVSPSINVDLGGAYVFDDNMKQQLTNDIATEVANGVRDAVANATSRLNTSYAG